MDVLELIGRLNDLVHEAKHVPLSSEVRVDKEELSDLLDQMRATIPEELKEARWIVKERDEMLASAEREAERILGEARERQTQLVVEHHLAGEAELASEDIIDHARAEEREIRLGAEDYADEILSTFEINLSKFIAAIQRGRERLQGADEPAAVEEYRKTSVLTDVLAHWGTVVSLGTYPAPPGRSPRPQPPAPTGLLSALGRCDPQAAFLTEGSPDELTRPGAARAGRSTRP
jgi:vacuolar-type H+-ATPase subunit H